ncbi:hypothetical protein BD769DRAFT_1383640 [Suillus cothurnatus]|nr:hypothetical protein BD769DRAFT_1383640 [Suillus cothurnatus]
MEETRIWHNESRLLIKCIFIIALSIRDSQGRTVPVGNGDLVKPVISLAMSAVGPWIDKHAARTESIMKRHNLHEFSQSGKRKTFQTNPDCEVAAPVSSTVVQHLTTPHGTHTHTTSMLGPGLSSSALSFETQWYPILPISRPTLSPRPRIMCLSFLIGKSSTRYTVPMRSFHDGNFQSLVRYQHGYHPMLEPSTNRDAMGAQTNVEGKEEGAVYRGRTTIFEHAGLTSTSSDYLRASAPG